MKHVFLALAVLVTGAVAHADQQPDPCSQFMICGNYEGDGNWYGSDGKAERDFADKINVTAVNANTLNIDVYIYAKGTDPKKGWNLNANLVFKADGQFELVDSDGDVHATGFCTTGVCNVSFRPVEYTQDPMKGKINAFTDTLRFKDGKLYLYNMVTDSENDADYRLQKSVLVKK